MKTLVCGLLSFVVVLGVACGEEGATPSTDTTPLTGLPAKVEALFKERCTPFHNEGATLFMTGHSVWGKPALGTTYLASAGKTTAECCAILTENGEMPVGFGCVPGKDSCPIQEDVVTLNNWVSDGASH